MREVDTGQRSGKSNSIFEAQHGIGDVCDHPYSSARRPNLVDGFYLLDNLLDPLEAATVKASEPYDTHVGVAEGAILPLLLRQILT